jgi:acetolactate synthase-1/2/3 large subunit
MDIDPDKLIDYRPDAAVSASVLSEDSLLACIEAVKHSQRPVLVYGWGIHLANTETEARELCRILGVPVAMTWAALDLLPYDDPLAIGGFGTHGTRYANFAVQNADLIISIGSRLDTKATGSPPSSFAREAKLIMLDIDPTEIRKFERVGRKVDLGISVDAATFLRAFVSRAHSHRFPDFASWVDRIRDWKSRYPACRPEFKMETLVNPYWLVKQLSSILSEGEVIFSDTGCALAWMMQGFEFKLGQRFFHAFNNTPMGYGLPGAMGASFARPGKRTVCVTGDGSLQMAIQELATVAHHRLPVKILLFNNQGHGMVRQTQEQWLGGNYYATSPRGGLACPDFVAVAHAYGFHTDTVALNADIGPKLAATLNGEGPAFLNIEIDPKCRVIPQVKFGRPNEDAEPLLEREEFLSNMIIKPLPVSSSS